MKHEHLTYHQWRGEPLPPVETFPAAMEAVTKQESPPTDNDPWESLLHKNSTLEKRVKELEVELTSVRPYADAYQRVAGRLGVKANLIKVIDEKDDQIVAAFKSIHELQSKLTATQARLAQLEWRPVSVMPTKKDAEPFGNVQVCGITNGILQSHGLHDINYPFKDRDTHWRPAALPEIPNPAEEEFKKWWESKEHYPVDVTMSTAWVIWQAAKKTNKENTKPIKAPK